MTSRPRDTPVSAPTVTSNDTPAAGYRIRRNWPDCERAAVALPASLAPVFNVVVLYFDDRVRASGGTLVPGTRMLLCDWRRAAEGAVIEPCSPHRKRRPG
jgi:hypothetical protein